MLRRRRGQGIAEFTIVLPGMIVIGLVGIALLFVAYNSTVATPQIARRAADRAAEGVASAITNFGLAQSPIFSTPRLSTSDPLFDPDVNPADVGLPANALVYVTAEDKRLVACRALLNDASAATVAPIRTVIGGTTYNRGAPLPGSDGSELRRLGWHWSCPSGSTFRSNDSSLVYAAVWDRTATAYDQAGLRAQMVAAMAAAIDRQLRDDIAALPITGHPTVIAVACLMSRETLRAALPVTASGVVDRPYIATDGCAARAELSVARSIDGTGTISDVTAAVCTNTAYSAPTSSIGGCWRDLPYGPAPSFIVVEIRGVMASFGLGTTPGEINTGASPMMPAVSIPIGSISATGIAPIDRLLPSCSTRNPECVGLPQ